MLTLNPKNNEETLKDKIPAHLWYKYFYKKPKEPKEFDSVQLPKVKKEFPIITIE